MRLLPLFLLLLLLCLCWRGSSLVATTLIRIECDGLWWQRTFPRGRLWMVQVHRSERSRQRLNDGVPTVFLKYIIAVVRYSCLVDDIYHHDFVADSVEFCAAVIIFCYTCCGCCSSQLYCCCCEWDEIESSIIVDVVVKDDDHCSY